MYSMLKQTTFCIKIKRYNDTCNHTNNINNSRAQIRLFRKKIINGIEVASEAMNYYISRNVIILIIHDPIAIT